MHKLLCSPQVRAAGELPGGGAGAGAQGRQAPARRAAAALRAPRPLRAPPRTRRAGRAYR